MTKTKQIEQQTESVSEYADKVKELEQTLGSKPNWFIGRMLCSKCNTERLVRYDVYLKRVVDAKAKDISEEELNASYVCKKCRSGKSVKKDAFFKMIEKQKQKTE